MTTLPPILSRTFVSVLCAAALAARAAPAAAQPDPTAQSDALFYEGMTLMGQGRLAEACDRLDRSLQLLRRGGTLLNLALCREAAGELEAALRLFEEALDVAVRDGRLQRQEVARHHIEALRSRLAPRAVALPTLHVVVRPGDGADPRDPPAGSSLSHRWQLGAIVRLDQDRLRPGARTAVGVTFGLGDHFEIGTSAVLGPDVGLEPQVTFFFLGRSAFKPLLNVGVPLFFTGGVHTGIRGGAGLAWDANRHLGFFAQIGGAYFLSTPEEVELAVLLSSVGVQGRL